MCRIVIGGSHPTSCPRNRTHLKLSQTGFHLGGKMDKKMISLKMITIGALLYCDFVDCS